MNNDRKSEEELETQQMEEGFTSSFWSWVFFRKWYFFKSVKSIIFCYSFLTIFFIFLAVLTGIIYLPLNQYEIEYADYKGCIGQGYDKNKNHLDVSSRCQVTFQIKKQLQPPIHFLYKLENIYINHRKYLSSFNKKQLEGNSIDEATAYSSCEPFVFNKDLGKNQSWSGKSLDPNAIASPCGFKGKYFFIRAFLFFNDTFKLKKIEADSVKNITIKEENIAQSQGKGLKYKSRNPDEEWINPSDSHFILWMQSQSLMTKQKLWGLINQTIQPGKYSLLVQNHYQINNMRIVKSIRITEASHIGDKNYTIPILFALFAIGSLAYTIFFHRRFKNLDESTNFKTQ